MDVRDNIVTLENNDIQSLTIVSKNSWINNAILKFEKIVKRAVDIIGGVCGTLLLVPLAIIIWIANKISRDNGPIFYKQERIGKNGKKFKMYKFRTMCIDSDIKLRELLEKDEKAREEWEENRKLKNDPRVTKIGKILRKTSLDEFPQFINVLKNDMSLVGPRAVVDGEIEKFGFYKNKVLSVKPGITGYWAANGRSSTTYNERVRMEATYVDRFSLILDIKIILKTFVAVLKKEGAF